MCLDINPSNYKIKKQGTRRVYKAYTPQETAFIRAEEFSDDQLQMNFTSTGLKVFSPYMMHSHVLKPGAEILSTRPYTSLKREEIHSREIEQGIHVFTNKRSALEGLKRFPNRILIECDAKASDHVADGTFGHINVRPSAVYMKITARKIIKTRP